MKKTLKFLIAAFAAVCFAVVANAQVTTSSISGKITDEQNQPVVAATVVATHQPTGTIFYALTDAKGYYYLSNITAGGPYKVEISCLGYNKQTYTDIVVALSDNYALSVKLADDTIALNAAMVSVQGSNSNMNSDRAGSITSLSSKQISTLPTMTRSLNDVLKQTPQAYVSGTKTYIGGGGYRDSYVTVDGAAMNNAFGIGSNIPAGGSPISLDAIEEMAIAITPFDVRQSGFTGGGINATTKSGTNELKVNVYGSFTNQNLKGYVVDGTDISYRKTLNQYLVYGASVGAPIIKDKLFLFLSLEKDSSIEAGPTSRVTDKEVDAMGNLVPVAGGNVFTNGNDGIVRPSGVVLDALSDYLKEKYGYDPGPYRDYNYETPSIKILARVDWNINENNKLSVRYNMVNSKYGSSPSTSTTGFANSSFSTTKVTSAYALYYKNARYYQEQNYSSVAGELNSRFLGGKLNNSLRLTYSHQYEPRSVDGGYFPTTFLVVSDDQDGNKDKIYTMFGTETFSYGNLRDVTTVLATDEITYNAGAHSILAGVQWESNQTKNGFQRMGAGAYVFNYASEQALYDSIKNGTLFDNPSQFAITHGNNSTFEQEYPHFTFNQFSAYVQDNITVNDNFKLTAGVRFEVPIYPSLDFNRNTRVEEATFAPTVNNPSGKYNTVDTPATRLSISPRVGFNWDIFGNRKVVLRGGTGIFVGRIPFVWIVGQSGDAGVLQTSVSRKAEQGIPTISNDRNEILNQLYPSGFTAEAAGLNLVSITLMDPQLKNPSTWKSSLALDVQLPGGILGSIEGVYKKDINVVTLKNIGLKSPVVLTSVPDIQARPYYSNGVYDGQITDAYLITNTDPGVNTGYYTSITAKLEKSFWKGLSARISYTYSDARVINDGVGDQPYSAWKGFITQMGTNSQELGFANYVMPHRIVANVTYSKDYAKYFGSSITLAYYGSARGRASIDYVSNIFGDGAYNYSLIEVPTKDALFNDWTFIDSTYKDEDGTTQTYTAAQQKEDFWNYIQSNKYLREHTGKIVERNSLISPWVNQFDLKFTQNFYFFTGKDHHRNTLQAGVDIQNFGNMLNSSWGNAWSIRKGDGYGNTIPLDLVNYEKVFTTGAKPEFQFQRDGTEVLDSFYTRTQGTSSTWSMLFSLRYIF